MDKIEIQTMVVEWLLNHQGSAIEDISRKVPFKKDDVVVVINRLVKYEIIEVNDSDLLIFTKDWTGLKLLKLIEFGITLVQLEEVFEIKKKAIKDLNILINSPDLLKEEELKVYEKNKKYDEDVVDIDDNVVLILDKIDDAIKGKAHNNKDVLEILKIAKEKIKMAKENYKKEIVNGGAVDFLRDEE